MEKSSSLNRDVLDSNNPNDSEALLQEQAHHEELVEVMQDKMQFVQDEKVPCFKNSNDIEQDTKREAQQKKIAAKLGDMEAQYCLAVYFADGYGVEEDHTKAVYWFKQAAEQGHIDAQYRLARAYATGIGVTKDEEKAVHWYRQAAEQGHIDAQYRLARCYAKGCGVVKNENEAVHWFRRAAEQGDIDAQCCLANLLLTSSSVIKNEAEAIEWYTRAAKQGDTEAQAYLKDLLTRRDNAKAQHDHANTECGLDINAKQTAKHSTKKQAKQEKAKRVAEEEEKQRKVDQLANNKAAKQEKVKRMLERQAQEKAREIEAQRLAEEAEEREKIKRLGEERAAQSKIKRLAKKKARKAEKNKKRKEKKTLEDLPFSADQGMDPQIRDASLQKHRSLEEEQLQSMEESFSSETTKANKESETNEPAGKEKSTFVRGALGDYSFYSQKKNQPQSPRNVAAEGCNQNLSERKDDFEDPSVLNGNIFAQAKFYLLQNDFRAAEELLHRVNPNDTNEIEYNYYSGVTLIALRLDIAARQVEESLASCVLKRVLKAAECFVWIIRKCDRNNPTHAFYLSNSYAYIGFIEAYKKMIDDPNWYAEIASHLQSGRSWGCEEFSVKYWQAKEEMADDLLKITLQSLQSNYAPMSINSHPGPR